MSATLISPQIGAIIQGTLESTVLPTKTTTVLNHSAASAPVVGSSAGQVSKAITKTITIASSGSPDSSIDLSSIADPQGNTVTFSIVQQIMLEHLGTATSNIVTPFGGSNGLLATGTQLLYAGGFIAQSCGTAGNGITVDGSHKIIKLTTAAGTNVQIKVTVVGR